MNATMRAAAAVAAAAFAICGTFLLRGIAAAAGSSLGNLKAQYAFAWYGGNAAFTAANTEFAFYGVRDPDSKSELNVSITPTTGFVCANTFMRRFA